MPAPLIAPSLLAADFSRLADEVRAAEKAGADWLHLDVMDGHFVPNLSFGPALIAALRNKVGLCFDVHLMIERPELSLAQYAQAGADRLTVHAEACTHLHRTLGQIRDLNKKAGVSLNPATPISCLEHVLPLCDQVLVMSVNPGFGGQKFLPEVLPKLAALRARRDSLGLDLRLAVDGGIGPQTIAAAAAAGADVFVAGSAVYGQADMAGAIAELRRRAALAAEQQHPGG